MSKVATPRTATTRRAAYPVLLGLLTVTLAPCLASASPISTSSKSDGFLGDMKRLGNWFQHQQTNVGSILDFSGSKSTNSSKTPGTPNPVGRLETSVGSLTPAEVHGLALAAVKQNPSLSLVDGLLPHTHRVVALETQRDLDPSKFDARNPQLGVLLSRDEMLRTNMEPLITQAVATAPASAEVIAAPSSSASTLLAPSAEVISGGISAVVPEPGSGLIALAMMGATALFLRRGRRL